LHSSTVDYSHVIDVIFISFSGAPFSCFDASQYGKFYSHIDVVVSLINNGF